MKITIGIISFVFLILSCSSENQSQIGTEYTLKDKFPFKDFDKVETYSFNRNKYFIDSIHQEIEKYELNFSNKELFDSSRIGIIYKRLNQLKEEGESSIILNEQSKSFSRTSQKVKDLSQKELKNLRGIFNYPTADLADGSLCIPIYRDALVFKKQDEIVGWINICFDCTEVKSYPDYYFLFSVNQWNELRKFFLKIGHPVKINKYFDLGILEKEKNKAFLRKE